MLLPPRGLRASFTFHLLEAAKEAVLPKLAKSASIFSLSYLLCFLSLLISATGSWSNSSDILQQHPRAHQSAISDTIGKFNIPNGWTVTVGSSSKCYETKI
jgi:hypothetical protein